MFCPLCRAEYREGFTRCDACRQELVVSLDASVGAGPAPENQSLEVVWRGSDPLAVSRAIGALREAGVAHYVKAGHDHFVFELAIPRPMYDIFVLQADLSRARELLEPIREPHPFGRVLADFSKETEAETAAVSRHTTKKDLKRAVLQVWSGDDHALAEVFASCLRENGIPARREGAIPGGISLFVFPDDEGRARVILREITEGAPPGGVTP